MGIKEPLIKLLNSGDISSVAKAVLFQMRFW